MTRTTRTALRTLLLAGAAALLLAPPAMASEPISLGAMPNSGQWFYGQCTRISDTRLTVVNNAENAAHFKIGVPIRYGDALYDYLTPGNYRRAVIAAVADLGATLQVDFLGAPMTAGYDGYCQYGPADIVRRDIYTINTVFANAADAALLLHDNGTTVMGSLNTTRYIVSVCAQQVTADTGAVEPAITFYVNGASVTTAALQLTDAPTKICSTTATIDPATYDQQPGETFEVGTTQGTNGNAAGLTVTVYWLFEL
jgi:hypothetical protein